VKIINNSHALRAKLKRIQKEKTHSCIALKLPVRTRWGSILACFKSLLESKSALKILTVEEDGDKVLDQKLSTIILDEKGFWERVDIMTKIFQSIVKWIILLESDDPKISEVPEAFKNINESLIELLPASPLTNQEKKEIKTAFAKRKGMAVKFIHFAANLLDPKFKGESLSSCEQIQGLEFIDKLSTIMDASLQKSILKELAEYRATEGFFAIPYVSKSACTVDPIVWWKGTCFGSNLGKLAVKILSMPASTAATERSFSTYGFVHSARRNRLTVDRAGMLTYVAHNLKLMRDCGRKNKIESVEADDDYLDAISDTESD